MTCPHQTKPQGKDTGRRYCALGWYGGEPWAGNCLDCLKHERNTADAKAIFDATQQRAHPPSAPRVSGCCDSASNYLTRER